MPAKGNGIKKRLIAIGILAIAFFLLYLLEDHPQTIERYYSQGFYLFICRVFHPVFNLFPFSVGDVFYIVLIGLIIYYLVRFIRLLFKKQFRQAGILVLGVVIATQALTLAFYLFWGLNYFRPSAAERLKLTDTDYSTQQLAAIAEVLIDSANITRSRLQKNDTTQNNAAIDQTAIGAVKNLSAASPDFYTYHPRIKSSLFSWLLNYMGTSGYYNPFTSESQLNSGMPFFIKPFVACHEMSHQMGYGAEDEANFVGFLAGVNSNDRLLRYSVYHEAVGEFMFDLMVRDSVLHKQVRACISPQLHHDFVVERAYWHQYQSQIETISSLFYDNFLKANNQPQGLMTYNRMIRLVISWHGKKKSIDHAP
ncbi:MAG: DUF3810 domain-containing protein [Mucilaginibacter sp.]